MADYSYGIIEIIREETYKNLCNLKDTNASSEIIEYENNILGFIDKVIKNYSTSYEISEDEEEEYFSWIDNKRLISGELEENEESSEEGSNEENSYSDDESSTYNTYLDIKYGEFEEAIVNGETLVVKAKISSSYSNKATINQNNFNVEDTIKKSRWR